MDSSRGGPLTNFIMVLPLIVVPLIAILRPADRDSGISGQDVSAAADGESLDDFGHLDFDRLTGTGANGGFADRSNSRATASNAGPAGLLEAPRDFSQAFDTHAPPTGLLSATTSDPDQQRRFVELERLGATRSMWFSPGGARSVGFAAFFPAGDGVITYRFGAEAESETAAMDEVIRQVREFQGTQPAGTPEPLNANDLPWDDFQ